MNQMKRSLARACVSGELISGSAHKKEELWPEVRQFYNTTVSMRYRYKTLLWLFLFKHWMYSYSCSYTFDCIRNIFKVFIFISVTFKNISFHINCIQIPDDEYLNSITFQSSWPKLGSSVWHTTFQPYSIHLVSCINIYLF